MSRVTLIGNLDLSQPVSWGCPRVDEPPDGWDTLTEMLWLPDPGFLAKGTERPAPAGLAGRFWVQDFRVLDWYAGRPLCEVVSYGLANNKPEKWTGQGLVNEDPTLVFGVWATVFRWQMPRVTKRWISLTTPLLTDHVGVAYVPVRTITSPSSPSPAVAYGAPEFPWTLVQAGKEWTATGWIGESRVNEQLVGADACLVTDTWLFDPGYDRTDQTDDLYTGP